MRTTMRNLVCRLTDEERIRYGLEISQQTVALAETVEAKKQAAAQFSAREKETQARINRLANMLTAGVEYRDVECTVGLDVDGVIETTVRNDTGEVIDSRKLMQPQLVIGDETLPYSVTLVTPEPEPSPSQTETIPEADPSQAEAIPEPDQDPFHVEASDIEIEGHETVGPVETREEQREALERVLAATGAGPELGMTPDDVAEQFATADAEEEATANDQDEGDGSDGYDIKRVSVIYRNTGGHLYYVASSDHNPDLFFVAHKTPRGQVKHYAGIEAGEMVPVLARLGEMAKQMHMTEVNA